MTSFLCAENCDLFPESWSKLDNYPLIFPIVFVFVKRIHIFFVPLYLLKSAWAQPWHVMSIEDNASVTAFLST